MKLQHVRYGDLNSRQKEIHNFHKIASLLADYGFNCMKLSDDWQGADFLAYHKDGIDTLKVQLKSRLTIDKKYIEKGLYIAFPIKNSWYLIEHDALVDLVRELTNWLNTTSWREKGVYHSDAPSAELLARLGSHILVPKMPLQPTAATSLAVGHARTRRSRGG